MNVGVGPGVGVSSGASDIEGLITELAEGVPNKFGIGSSKGLLLGINITWIPGDSLSI